MAHKNYQQLIDALKAQLGSVPQNLDAYVQKGDCFFAKDDFDVAAGIYELAAQVAPSGHLVHEKRLDAIEK